MTNLDKLVLEARENQEILDRIIRDYRPFILASASKVLARHINIHDDEASIALIAFNEAIEAFDPDKGHFVRFAERLIRLRLIDYLRKQTKLSSEITFSSITKEADDEVDIYLPVTEETVIEDPVYLEIEALKAELSAYGFKFSELVKVSPKSQKTKKACALAVNYILKDKDLLDSMRETRRLPIKELEKNIHIPRKIMERHRKYIIAAVEILANDFYYLAGYLKGVREEGEK